MRVRDRARAYDPIYSGVEVWWEVTRAVPGRAALSHTQSVCDRTPSSMIPDLLPAIGPRGAGMAKQPGSWAL